MWWRCECSNWSGIVDGRCACGARHCSERVYLSGGGGSRGQLLAETACQPGYRRDLRVYSKPCQRWCIQGVCDVEQVCLLYWALYLGLSASTATAWEPDGLPYASPSSMPGNGKTKTLHRWDLCSAQENPSRLCPVLHKGRVSSIWRDMRFTR